MDALISAITAILATIVITLPLAAIAGFYSLWLFYLALMNLIRAKESGKLSRPALILGYPILIVGYILDILMNATFVSLLVMDLPRELTVSSHLCRLSRDGNRWQRTVSTFICEQLLDAFDPSGKHCKR